MSFYTKLEKLGPEHSVAFLSEEFFSRYLFPNMEEIDLFARDKMKINNLYAYAENVWIYSENNLRDQFKSYADLVIDILKGDKENKDDREKASSYIKDYINDNKLVKWFKMK